MKDTFNLKSFLTEHNMTLNSKRMGETMHGDIRSFSKQLRKDLTEAGFTVIAYKEASITEETKREVHLNKNVACLVVKEQHPSVDRLEVYINESKTLDLKKVIEKYQTVEGTYGPEILNEWFEANAYYAMKQGIYRSKVSKINPTYNISQVTYTSIN